MSTLLTFLWQYKKETTLVLLTIFLSYAVFMLFKKDKMANDATEINNKSISRLEKNISKLNKEKDSILLENKNILISIRKDSLAASKIKKDIAAKEVIVYRQRTNIKTIKDKYEAVYRLDSVTDDELLRLFSEHHIEANPNKK